MATKRRVEVDIQFEKAALCPVDLLDLDLNNPRLQTGTELDTDTEEEVISTLSDIAALDELITSICTNKYLNLEPLIVLGASSHGRFRVIEGNRRLAAIRLIQDEALCERLNIKVKRPVAAEVLSSIEKVLVYRVRSQDDARAFIGFKHINGPQRWDAYAKARYVTEWYKKAERSVGIDEIAARMGDNNNTLRAYIYSILMLEQAEAEDVWSISDRATSGRFAFSHLYTAIGRKEYQQYVGLPESWSDKPPLKIIKRNKLTELGEVLQYIYGAKSDERPALVRSQNPDLKDVGYALANPNARLVLQQRGTLDEARDALKDPSVAFMDALVAVNIRVSRAVQLLPKYDGGSLRVDELIDEIYEQADTLKTMNEKKKKKQRQHAN